MTQRMISEEKVRAFWEDIREVCKKHDLAVASDDPYCGLAVLSGDFTDRFIDQALKDAEGGITFYDA